jgi:hypothetical protein
MRLQKHFSRKFKGKQYYKWVIVIPDEDIVELGWKEGEELQSKIFRGGLLLFRKKSNK